MFRINQITNPRFALAMNDADEADATEAPAKAKPKRRKVANHEFRGADGKKVTNPTNATLYAYQFVDDNGDPAKDDEGNLDEIVQDVTEYPQEIIKALALFGLKTKTTNTTSQARQADADEREAVQDMVSSFLSGAWTGDRGESMAGVKLLAESIIRAKGGDWKDSEAVERMVAWLSDQSEDDRDGLEKNAAVKSAMKLIRAERVIERTQQPTSTEGLDDIPV
jgi:hypothetical protein